MEGEIDGHRRGAARELGQRLRHGDRPPRRDCHGSPGARPPRLDPAAAVRRLAGRDPRPPRADRARGGAAARWSTSGVESTVTPESTRRPGVSPDRGVPLGPGRLPRSQRRLNAFLERAVDVARANFHGEITYSAGPGRPRVRLEPVRLRRPRLLLLPRPRAGHVRELGQFRRFGRPILITEFGTNAFEGAPELEGDGWSIVDYSKPVPEISRQARPQRAGAGRLPRRDARDLRVAGHPRRLRLRVHLAGRVVLAEPALRSRPGLVRDREGDSGRPQRRRPPRTGWEPKQAFHALADYYASDDD